MNIEFSAAYEGKTVAITGASGYLAAAILDALGTAPARILRVSRGALKLIPGTEVIQADIRSDTCWREITSCADVIFHLASNTSMYAAVEDPIDSLTSTVQPVVQLVMAARALRRSPRVVLAATATQYGLTKNLPVNEETSPHPITTYDLHKLFAEKQLLLATSLGLLDGVSLRLANVYGPSSNASSAGDRGILNKTTKMALQGTTLQLYGGGHYVRDYVYVADVARAFLAAGIAKATVGRSFNVASGRGTTIREAFGLVARRVEDATGKTVCIEDVPWPAGVDPIECRNFVGDITAFNMVAGWTPLVSLEEGIDRMIQELKGKVNI